MNWLKRGIKRYDDWCKEMGITPDQKRSCVPYRKEPTNQSEPKKVELHAEESETKQQNEAL